MPALLPSALGRPNLLSPPARGRREQATAGSKMAYQAPVDEILTTLKSSGQLERLASADALGGLDEETIRSILEEAGRFGSEVLDPLNRVGDKIGSRLVDGRVETPPGWAEAYRQFAAGGWSALPCPVEYGGQGLPAVVAMAVSEIWNSANLSFGLCPLLTNGAIDAVHIGGSEELKSRFLPSMISGLWTGTMNLTEPQAGSDLNAVAARAERHPDGTYRIKGTKIFITYGDHELTENIIHLVLARLPDAPAGTRGISLFLVPKVLLGEDGTLQRPNDVVCAGLEHKLGINASPTCVMKFGENGGAVGYLVGEENRGLATMFIMMNAARLAVGVQGVAVAERATQRAIEYARERRQGRLAGSSDEGMAPIIAHPDIRRTILTMRALTQASRGICLATAAATDLARVLADENDRQEAADRVALLTPVAKAFSTDVAVRVASLGVQVHGGMGFIEETGAAQYLRDARILPIYEGTNGIQAIDLLMRKLPLAGGGAVRSYLGEVSETLERARAQNAPGLAPAVEPMAEALQSLEEATRYMGRALGENPDAALAGATPYTELFGIVAGGHALLSSALSETAERGGAGPGTSLAVFFANNITPLGSGLARSVIQGADSVLGPDLGAAA